MLTQAASSRSTRAWAMLCASFSVDAVHRTMMTAGSLMATIIGARFGASQEHPAPEHRRGAAAGRRVDLHGAASHIRRSPLAPSRLHGSPAHRCGEGRLPPAGAAPDAAQAPPFAG